jgi:hypothetical protein
MSVREQLAAVIEDHHTVAEQAPALLRVGGHDACGRVIVCVRRGAWRPVQAHDTFPFTTDLVTPPTIAPPPPSVCAANPHFGDHAGHTGNPLLPGIAGGRVAVSMSSCRRRPLAASSPPERPDRTAAANSARRTGQHSSWSMPEVSKANSPSGPDRQREHGLPPPDRCPKVPLSFYIRVEASVCQSMSPRRRLTC